MKKLIVTIAVVSFLSCLTSLSFAQMDKGKMMGDQKMMMDKGNMMQEEKDCMKCKKGMMKEKKEHMWHKMFNKPRMMDKSIVSTGDGGVIVLIGNRLVKYDKDLNVVKEVEIKLPENGSMNPEDMRMMKDMGSIKK